MMNVNQMFGVCFILVYPVLFLGANGQDSTCSTSWGSSCPSVSPQVSGPTCPEGFDQVEKYCFKISDEQAYWDESKNKCEELNAILAEPRGLLIGSTVFAKYLVQNTIQSKNLTIESNDYFYYYYEEYAENFNIGGQLTDNHWEWTTGGKINNSYYNIQTYYDCLALENWEYIFYSYYDYADYGFDEDEYIGLDLFPIPCNKTEYKWASPYRYICQAPLENNNYRSCGENGKYPSGELVSMNEQECQQHWCQDGIIKHYTCGNITTGCCEYKGELYGDGDIIGPEVPTEDCSGCQQRVCRAGVLQWQSCTNCSIMCCLFNGASYQPGSSIQNVCTRLVCDGTTGQFNYQGIDYKCPRCKVYLDPHIVTYDQKYSSYSYQGCGTYSLSQIGSSYNPSLAIFATFVPCGGSSYVTCVDTVTFKNDEHTVITIGSNPEQIQVNGNDYTVPSSSPSIVQVLNTVYPVLAWKSSNCVALQGSSGILVKFCWSSWANQVYVWADSGVAGGLEGLCGTANDNVNDDFTTRGGIITSPWQRNPPEEFPLSWLASDTSNGNCVGTNGRKKRQAENKCDADSSVQETFLSECYTTVTSRYPDAEPEEAQTIIDDCVFDLCNVSDPGAWIRAVQEAAEVQAEIQENTLNCFWLGELHPQNSTRTGECGMETCEAGSWVLNISTSTCITEFTTTITTTMATTTTTTLAPTTFETTAEPSTTRPITTIGTTTNKEVPTQPPIQPQAQATPQPKGEENFNLKIQVLQIVG